MSTTLDATIHPSPRLSPREMLARNISCLGERNRDLAEQLTIASAPADLEFFETGEGVPCATLGRKQLCSRHRPMEEASRMADAIDLVEHAVIVVFGFGLGYHVQRLAERMKKAGVIIVFEPDMRLLRAVFERIDMTAWMSRANIVWLRDADDRAAVASKVDGSEAIIAQGVEFLEHPASRARLGDAPSRVSAMLRQYISTSKTTLMTTLIRSVDTVRNMVHNIDHYVSCAGIVDLKDACKDKLAIVVSAGPSLHRSMRWLSQPGVRDRCIIIAVQTTLKPLLEAGVKPHFVTALDYHEISRRFYEQIDPDDVRDVTLIVEPKAHPVILDSYPGPIRCCGAGFLDALLGPEKREMGALKAGATVAHLALYVAEHLGCNPIALVGQDLGFTDGLYYAPGIAIEDAWAPELNPFNTMEMMQWQRVARHRGHLQKVEDVNGRWIYTDAQMLAYLRQFERDFAELREKGVRVIDATEGGVAKQHTSSLSLRDVLKRHAVNACTPPPTPMNENLERASAACEQLERIRREVVTLRHAATRARPLIERMKQDQHDPRRMEKHFQKLEKQRAEVERRMDTFELLNQVNQLGAFKRLKADRRLHMAGDLSPMERQQAELDRDLENVRWIADAAGELQQQLSDGIRLLNREKVSFRPKPSPKDAVESGDDTKRSGRPRCERTRIAALVPIEPRASDSNGEVHFARRWGDGTILQATLQRVGRSKRLDCIILLTPDDYDVDSLIDVRLIDLPVAIERCGDRVFPPEHDAIMAARAWSPSCWRGGITGVTIYDELLAPQVMQAIMEERKLTAALLVGPDWPMVNVTGETGCDALIERHLDYPDQNSIVFSQAPPGLCGCVISAREMDSLAQRNRVATIGARLTYQPSAPQPDPIAKDLCVQVNRDVRASLSRVTADTTERIDTLRGLFAELNDERESDSADDVIHGFERAIRRAAPLLPQHLIIELTTRRTSTGVFADHPFGPIKRPDMTPALLLTILSQCQDKVPFVVTFDGLGDPLRHEQFDECIAIARRCGARAVHVRTELSCDRPTIDRLMESAVDVVSVDLHADRAATYQCMMGCDRFPEVLQSMDYALNRRRHFTAQTGLSAIALPWFVPRIMRCIETIDDIDSFYDRWQHALGTCVIEGKPRYETGAESDVAVEDDLLPTPTPRRVVERELRSRMTIFSDGSVPIDELDLSGRETAGQLCETPIVQIWNQLYQKREARMELLRLRRP